MKKRTGVSILIPANLLALLLLVGSHTSSASAAESFWCDPGGGSQWCLCHDPQEFLPGGCWEMPDPIQPDCFNNSHCED